MPDKQKKKKASAVTPAEKKLFNQMRYDEAHPTKKNLAQEAGDQAKVDKLVPFDTHPDAASLIKAGMPKDRAEQLARSLAPSHPAVTQSTPQGATPYTTNPTTPAQFAADDLYAAGLPNTASNEKLLEAQMTEEGMPGSENNPLATSVQEPGSSAVNSAGVQDFPTAAEGVAAQGETLQQPNMSSIYQALKSGTATPQQYAQALAASAYEGNDAVANAAYAQNFLADAGQPESTFPGGGPSAGSFVDTGSGSAALAQAASASPFTNLSGLFGASGSPGTAASSQSLQNALAGLSSPSAQNTLTANTSQAPGSPDQTPSQAQQTSVNPASLYQAQLLAQLPGIKPGGAG
jgi:hypothetical protein